MTRDIKTDIEAFLSKTGISCYRLCKEARVSKTIVYYLLQDKSEEMSMIVITRR